MQENHPGIYHVSGSLCVPAQVVVTSRLPDGEYESFKILAKNAKEKDVVRFLEHAYQNPSKYMSTILRVSMAANRDLYRKLKEESSMMDVFEDLFHNELMARRNEGISIGEARGITIGEERARRSIMERLVAAGIDPTGTAAWTDISSGGASLAGTLPALKLEGLTEPVLLVLRVSGLTVSEDLVPHLFKMRGAEIAAKSAVHVAAVDTEEDKDATSLDGSKPVTTVTSTDLYVAALYSQTTPTPRWSSRPERPPPPPPITAAAGAILASGSRGCWCWTG